MYTIQWYQKKRGVDKYTIEPEEKISHRINLNPLF